MVCRARVGARHTWCADRALQRSQSATALFLRFQPAVEPVLSTEGYLPLESPRQRHPPRGTSTLTSITMACVERADLSCRGIRGGVGHRGFQEEQATFIMPACGASLSHSHASLRTRTPMPSSNRLRTMMRVGPTCMVFALAMLVAAAAAAASTSTPKHVALVTGHPVRRLAACMPHSPS